MQMSLFRNIPSGLFKSKASASAVEGAGACKESDLGIQLSHPEAELRLDLG